MTALHRRSGRASRPRRTPWRWWRERPIGVTRMDYDLAYYDLAYYDRDGVRHDLAKEIRATLQWCEAELNKLEAALPDIDRPERIDG
jgi:hypothetical protein